MDWDITSTIIMWC